TFSKRGVADSVPTCYTSIQIGAVSLREGWAMQIKIIGQLLARHRIETTAARAKRGTLRQVLVAAACAAGLAGSAVAFTLWSGVLGPLSATMANRLNRNGVASTCAAVKLFPGTLASPSAQFSIFGWTNPGPTRCVTFSMTSSTCPATSVFLSAYN